MRLLLLFALIFTSVAEAKIVLLTSFRKNKEQSKAERSFRRALRIQVSEELEVIHKADQWTLYQALQNPEVHALFWISHGVSGRRNQTVEGATLLPKLLDYRGDNVAPVFSLIAPTIKFISIIGCNSAAILQHYGVNVSNVAHYIPVERRVALQRQVPRSIRAYRATDLTREIPEPTPVESVGTITISREVTSVEGTRSMRVFIGDRLVGLMPNSSSTHEFNAPAGTNLKVKIESGQDPSVAQAEFGEFTISSSDITGQWTLFANAQGVPFGVNHRLYIYRR